MSTKREVPEHLEGNAEADIESVKVFLGPPETKHKGLHGLGEETSDQVGNWL